MNVVITPGDLRDRANGHIREIGLFIHDITDAQIAEAEVMIFEDEARTKVLTEFPLASRVVRKLDHSVRALTGLNMKPVSCPNSTSLNPTLCALQKQISCWF